MLDTANENLISLTEAARSLPHRRAGRPTHVATVRRWILKGVRGVKLDSVQVGGVRCTSREALTRFYAALTNNDGASEPAPSATARAEQAGRELDRLWSRSVN